MKRQFSQNLEKGGKRPLFSVFILQVAFIAGVYAAEGLSPAMNDFTLDFEAADVFIQNSTCVIFSNGGDSQTIDYEVTISEVGAPAAGFAATNATYPSYALPVYLTWRDDDYPTTPLWSVTDGTAEGVLRTGNTTSGCASTPNLSYLVVEYRSSDYLLSYAPAGLYSTTIDILYTEDKNGNPATFTDTVVLNVDINELTSVSNLSDVVLEYPPDWQAGDNIDVEEDFCVYTNDVGGDVYITASSTTIHNDASNFGLDNGSGLTRRYNVALRETGGSYATLGGNMDNGATIGPLNTQGSNIDCTNIGDNAQVRIRVPSGQAENAQEGTYSGTLEFLVTVP